MPFVRAYPRESQEMVFDAHARAFELFKGACTRGIYDNMKTAVMAPPFVSPSPIGNAQKSLSQERDRWFESASLQRRVCELLVPKRRSPICCFGSGSACPF